MTNPNGRIFHDGVGTLVTNGQRGQMNPYTQ